MKNIKIEFNTSNPPKYWKNFLHHLDERYYADYQSYTLAMQCELSKFEAALNPYFAYNNRNDTLFFNDTEKFNSFIEKWGNNEY